MPAPAQLPEVARAGQTVRRCLAAVVLGVCGLLLVHVFALEAFQVPTGSMAPALLGQHRRCTCPCCGFEFAVGRHPGDHGDCAGCYRKAACPNCGEHPPHVSELPEASGDQVLVDKTAYLLQPPRRWQIVVLRLFGSFIIKRVIGLPMEELLLRDGDVYVDGRLARKSFEQALAMRVPVCDQGRRWELDGRASPQSWTYPHFLREERKGEPLTDEYAYNSGAHAGLEPVHDFLLEANIEVLGGTGTLALRLCDGQDWVEVEVPVGASSGSLRARRWPRETPDEATEFAHKSAVFEPGRRYHVDMALVDRRLSFVVDGRVVLSADLPEPNVRGAVVTPVQMRTDGVAVRIHNFRLYRDIHYSQQGANAVHGRPVLLGAGQYFVLGDNSPDSEDSRFWPDAGRVAAEQLVGRALLVHFPSRALGGGEQVPDWSRIRWLR